MADGNYNDILNQQWDNIPKPQVLPDGSYVLKGRNASFVPPKGEGNPRVLFFYNPKEPMDDVDAGALAELGKNYDIQSNQIVATFWIENTSDWDKVRNHLAKAGVDLQGKSVQEGLKAFKGTETIAFLSTRTYQDAQNETRQENVPSNFTAVE